MLISLAWITTILYCSAGILQGFAAAYKAERWVKYILLLSAAAILGHAYLLYQWIDVSGGQNLTFFNTLSQVIWIATVVVWLMALRRPIYNLGLILYPLAGISILCVLAFSGSYIINTDSNPGHLLHILLSFLALGIAVVMVLQALFLGWLDHALRKKYSNTLLESFPSLQKMESVLFQLVALGFVILALVIFSGFKVYSGFYSDAILHHMVLAIIAWIIFGVLLLGRFVRGWRGQQAIRWSLIGASLLFLAFIMSYFWNA